MESKKIPESKGKILIVEDEFITAVSIQKLLEKHNYSVLGIAGNWNDAEELLKTGTPDLLIMDINLGDDTDGIEVSLLIKEEFDIPVIFVTAYSDDATIQRAKQISPYGFLIKPFDNRELYSAVEMAFVKHSAEKIIKQSEKKYRDIFENIQDVYFEVLVDGTIVELSPSIKSFSGGQYSREDLLNHNITEYYYEPFKRELQIEAIMKSGFLNDYEFDLRNKDNSIIHASVNSRINFGKDGNPERIIGSIRNITDRKVNDLIMQARFNLIRYSETHNSDELLALALDEIERLTGSKIGFYHFVNKDQKNLTLQNWSTNTIKNMCSADGKGAHYPINQAGVWVDCIYQRKPVIHNDYENLGHKKGMPEGHAKVIREAVVPIYRDEKAVAIIGVGNKETNYDDYDINIISQIGDLSWDIVERKRAEEELEREKELLATIVNNLPIALYVKDREGKKIITNPMDCTNLGLEKNEIIGKTDMETLPVEIAAKTFADDMRVIKEGIEILNKEELLGNGSSTKWLLTTKIPYIDGKGEIEGLIGMGADITARKKAEEELELHRNHLEELVEKRTKEIEEINLQLKREIEREKEVEKMLMESLNTEKHLSELKSRFISTASHEFKTPLTTVLSSIELIERYGKNWDSEKYNKHIMRIKESVDNLTKLLDDVLTISRSESGKMQFSPVVLDVKELCNHFLDEVRYVANESHLLELNFHSEENEFTLDPKLMRYVIINLLSNAIKYSPNGGKVRLVFTPGSTHLNFLITDEGIGIPPEDQNNLCEPFYRANNAFEFEGTGLGLSIVKRSLDLMNGIIKFRSLPGNGTIVEINIPRH